MDVEELLGVGLALAFFVFGALWLTTVEFSPSSDPNAVQNVKKPIRFLYAFVMTVVPTSELAIGIDLGAAIVASIGLMKGAKESVKFGIAAAAAIYFFVGFVVNYLAAPF